MSESKKFYIENLGCAKNQVDAETVWAQLEKAGLFHVDDPAEADVILVNTCGFIAPAKEESINVLCEMRQSYPDAKVFALGCLAQRYGKDLLKSFPELDGVIGNRNMDEVGRAVMQVLSQQEADSKENSGKKTDSKSMKDPTGCVNPSIVSSDWVFRKNRMNTKGFAFVKISEGCKRRCAFCAIPHIRGDVYSRSIAEIVKEIDGLVDDGVFEINLVAQNLFDYGCGELDRFESITDKEAGETNLVYLLKQIFKIPKKFVVRLLYMHPDTFDNNLIDLMAKEERLLPYLDIPFQHASVKLLRKMNRVGTPESYLDLIARIRAVVPNVVIRSTFMLGFPGETKQDFKALCDFIIKAQLDWAGFFTYSREEDTAAYEMTNSLKNAIVTRRAKRWLPKVQALQEEVTEKRLHSYIGKELDVLIEEAVEGEELFLGRGYFQAPEVDGLIVVNGEGFKPGDVVHCKIIRVNGVDLEAVVAN